MIGYEELDNLNYLYAKAFMTLKQKNASTRFVSEAYLWLSDLNLKEESLFIYLVFCLSLSQRCLWFLAFESIDRSDLLTYWDPMWSQYKK